MSICITENCDRIASPGKLCKYCYNKLRLASITKICKIEGCNRIISAKELCAKHYYIEHNYGRKRKCNTTKI